MQYLLFIFMCCWWGVILLIISKKGVEGAQIPKFCIFERYLEFVFVLLFLCVFGCLLYCFESLL
jgi:hypothetical protein